MHCSDLDELVTLAVHGRGLDPFATVGLVGLDQGQGSLEVGLTLVDNSADADKENKYSQDQPYFLPTYIAIF